MSVTLRVQSRAAHAVASNGALIALLSPRLLQTLGLLVSGASEKEAAARLQLSVDTVHCHCKELHRRFGVESRAELIVTVVFDYLLDPDAVAWVSARVPRRRARRRRPRGD